MTPRPCTWPDGGCGKMIVDVVTVAGRKQVLDATAERRIVLVNAQDTLVLSGQGDSWADARARVVPVYVDHHATCSAFKQYQERRRANA